MKLSTQWKTLTRDQRRVWNAWAKSNPVLLDDGSLRRVSEAHAQLRFVKCLSLGVLNVDDLVSTFGTDYAAVHGSWDGPGADGAWPADKFIWFRLHQYANGQLGPGAMMQGLIQVEL